MPVKKITATEEKKPTTKKATAKAADKKEKVAAKTSEKKEAVAAKPAAEKTATKKTTKKTTKKATTTAKKTTAAKKPAAKKAATKTTAKKTTKKAAPAVEVVKKSVKDYEDIINWKKGEAHAMDWLYIEVNAGDLLTEVEAGVDNLNTVCNAILNCMLEGDGFINEPAEEDKVNATLTVRYYCDNLSQDRKKYFDR